MKAGAPAPNAQTPTDPEMQRYGHEQHCPRVRGAPGAQVRAGAASSPQWCPDLGRGAEGPLGGAQRAVSFGGAREGKVGFPPSPPPNAFVFPLGLGGFQPSGGRRRGQSPRQSPKPHGAPAKPAARCVDGCVCTEGEARPRPRTTHNSVHSRLGFLQNLLPEETSAMAGAERGWGLGEWAGCLSGSTQGRVCRQAGAPGAPTVGSGDARARLPLAPGKRVSASAGSALPLF